ncbi:MAG: glycosyltransferase family 4 protein [Deltaproteobacteria bacterium]|nr:glycosyltransferase family 4 protein [Deltaproteobacteria bacterium]
MNTNNKICIVVATPLTIHAFLRDQIQTLSHYFEITIVANFLENHEYKINLENVKLVNIPLVRPISPVKDLLALFRLYIFFQKEHFCLVHSITPKAGLIGMAAAFFAHIPIRIHTYTGQVWVTRKGISRWVLKFIDRIIGFATTHTYADSLSQRDFIVKNKIVPSNKIKVLADGSISGVDLIRFRPDALIRQHTREMIRLTIDSVVILFLGRMNPDKGIIDLITAFRKISYDNIHLVMVGPDECGIQDQLPRLTGQGSQQIHFLDYTSEPEKLMAAADIFCLPSYREGFGSVVIEAAACGLPSVVSQIYGLTDAVIHGSTGLLYPPGDINRLVCALQKLVDNPVLRRQMGMAARTMVENLFSQDRLTQAVLAEYLAVTGHGYNKPRNCIK